MAWGRWQLGPRDEQRQHEMVYAMQDWLNLA